MVQEGELGVKEFQMAVLSALLNLMKEQESLNQTLKALTDKEKVKLEEIDNLFSEDSSDEEDERRGSAMARPKLYKSGHTQTGQNTTILYYHESKKAALEETLPLLEEDDVDLAIDEEDKTAHTQYKWKKRVPASKFGVIIKAEGKRRDHQFADEIISVTDDTDATKYGKLHEKDAIKKLEQVLGVDINEPKKFVDKDHTFLVSIPDGLIENDKLVEIKCPYKCSKTTMESLARSDESFCLKITEGGRLKLKENHDYYYQVQGELNICKRDVCYFVVWSPTEFHYQVIQRDQHFWDVQMFPWLLDFHRIHILEDKWKVVDISEEESADRSSTVLHRLQTSRTRQLMIERDTRGQGRNPEWTRERKERLTASNFGRVAKMRSTTSCQNTVISILYPDKLDNIEAIKYGKDNEKKAIEDLNRFLAEEVLCVEECGLFVSTEKGYLAASPDGIVGKDGLVEVKCPIKCIENSIEDLARQDQSFCLQFDFTNEKLRLKRNHNYYYQIQGQLHISNRSKCYFMVWSPTEYHLEIIEYDPEFWEDMEEILEHFYMNCLLPEIVDPRAPRGLPVREPEYILQAQNLKNLKI